MDIRSESAASLTHCQTDTDAGPVGKIAALALSANQRQVDRAEARDATRHTSAGGSLREQQEHEACRQQRAPANRQPIK